MKKRFDIGELFFAMALGAILALIGNDIYSQYKATHVKSDVEQIKEPLPGLDYGWHCVEDKQEGTFLSHNGNQIRIRFEDGCMAGWHEQWGYFWMTYQNKGGENGCLHLNLGD